MSDIRNQKPYLLAKRVKRHVQKNLKQSLIQTTGSCL
jgi:hypothetical protein